MGQVISQEFPPAPISTEKTLPDQSGRVYLVTGATSGVGKALAGILYGANAKVYATGRSQDKADAMIANLTQATPDSRGELIYLEPDLSDLAAVKKSATEFLSKETRLDVLFNNAGVFLTPKGAPKTKQGYEIQLGTNAVGPFLFTKLLIPTLLATARQDGTAPGQVRVVWASSSFASYFSPYAGVDLDNLDYQSDRNGLVKHSSSKAANVLYYSAEFARRYGKDNVISVSVDPGNLTTELHRHSFFLFQLLVNIWLHDGIYGAYTELFAGLSPEVTLERNNAFLGPWGRFVDKRKDIHAACEAAFWQWTENQVKDYI
ncbi:retinol dehydrogenase 12 [Xylariomycetidae sp. FL2044]|nr:retinol dehydrogenase 12 [Xylariomycetidae sp. FL2044]